MDEGTVQGLGTYTADVLQMSIKCLRLPCVAWDPAKEIPSTEGTLIASQSCLEASCCFAGHFLA